MGCKTCHGLALVRRVSGYAPRTTLSIVVLRPRTPWPLAALTAVMVLTACGSEGSRPPLKLSQADQGRVVKLAPGQRAVVRLNQPEWAFAPVSGRAVRAVQPARLVFVHKGCKALPACGYVTLTVKALARGRSAIVATRGICGEDFRCPPSQRKFALTVVVQ